MTGQKSRGPQGGIGGDDNCLTVLILDRLSLAQQFALIHALQTSLQEKNAIQFSSRICWQGYHVGACTTKLARWVDDCDQADLKRWRGTEVNLINCLADVEAHGPANFLLQYSRAAVMKEFERRGVRFPIPLWAVIGSDWADCLRIAVETIEHGSLRQCDLCHMFRNFDRRHRIAPLTRVTVTSRKCQLSMHFIIDA